MDDMTGYPQLQRDLGQPGRRRHGPLRLALGAAAVAWLSLAPLAAAAQDAAPAAAPAPAKEKVEALLPDFEAMIEKGMADFAVPGTAVAVVVGDEVVYAKGFGVRAAGGAAVDTGTLFQIGSTTKAFLATTLAILVDENKLEWAQRVLGVDPTFTLHDPWVTREFRVYDLLAQRSGMRPYVNDVMTGLGYDADALIYSLRFAEPITSFRSTFGYVNILHLITGRIVAHLEDKPDWFAVAQERILAPLGMTRTTSTAEAMEADANHAEGHRFDGKGAVAIPFDPSFPYILGPAGNINSSVDDMTKWVRTLIGRGSFEGKQIVSEANLRYTWTPKVSLNDQQAYALGWVIQELPEGRVIWHNGGTAGFGAHVGLIPEENVGIVVLSNSENRGFPDATAMWFYRKVLGEPDLDVLGQAATAAKAKFDAEAASYVKPADARPPRPLADLAGRFGTQEFGPAAVTADGDRLVMTLERTGAKLALEPFDGDVFTVRLLPEGRFAAIVATSGDQPTGFAQFQIDAKGHLDSLRLILDEQPYLFDRTDD
jgi:CubicO group peptidase (beta-lactamase class C family)